MKLIAFIWPTALADKSNDDSDSSSLTESDSESVIQDGDTFGHASEQRAVLDNATLTALAKRVISEVGIEVFNI